MALGMQPAPVGKLSSVPDARCLPFEYYWTTTSFIFANCICSDDRLWNTVSIFHARLQIVRINYLVYGSYMGKWKKYNKQFFYEDTGST
jgi:hypothetical protein